MNKNQLKDIYAPEKNLPKRKNNVFTIVKEFLITYANDIQKAATEHHKEYLGGEEFRSEYIDKYQKFHTKIVEEIAKNLLAKDIKQGTTLFKKLGEKFAKDSVKDGLTLQESVDGIVFLKEAIWQKMDNHGILDMLSVKDFYQISHAIGTYSDVIATKLAFSYHSTYIKDLTEEKNQVVQAVNIRDNFISTASHELKTPITSLKIYTQSIKRKVKDKGIDLDLKDHMEKIDNQLHKLTLLVEDLLSVSKLQHGKLEFTMTPFKLNEVMEESVETIEGTSKQHKIIIIGEIKQKVRGDRYRIYQVIVNLLTNAIKYSPKAKKVIINLIAKKKYALVEVEDFGIGITLADQKKIFEQFYRVSGKKEKTFPGMGMGLFIANEIIKRHGGTISVTSKKGKGSKFRFTLPYDISK